MTNEKQEIERPPAPQGSVYVQDVLDIVRRHADLNSWCNRAEDTVNSLFAPHGIEISYAPMRGYCCRGCNNGRDRVEHAEFVEKADPRVFERFSLVGEQRDTFVSKKMLAAMFAEHTPDYDTKHEELALIEDIRLIFGVSAVVPAMTS